MILSVVFSKPSKVVQAALGKSYTKIRAKWNDEALCYQAEFFTEKQSFQKTFSSSEFETFVKQHAGTSFKNVIETTETEEITILANRHGEIKTLTKKRMSSSNSKAGTEKSAIHKSEDIKAGTMMNLSSFGKKKNYILEEGRPVPFLVKLGVMTKEGKVIAAKYDKFRQINRFLEFIKDIVPEVISLSTNNQSEKNLLADSTCPSAAEIASSTNSTHTGTAENVYTKDNPLRISDFGCGKSYLTFAIYYYLTELLHIPVEITGIDLKEDVIENCAALAKELGYSGLHFFCGDVALFSEKNPPDIMITLHACDTATDYALNYAIKCEAKAILSVPCCQHEINLQLEKNGNEFADQGPFASLERYGLLRERFASLATDALRDEYLEQKGYKVQVLEFIDMEHTPKNILLRAVRKTSGTSAKAVTASLKRADSLLEQLHVSQTLHELLQD